MSLGKYWRFSPFQGAADGVCAKAPAAMSSAAAVNVKRNIGHLLRVGEAKDGRRDDQGATVKGRNGPWPGRSGRTSPTIRSRVRSADHDLLDSDVRRAVRDAVGLRRLALRVTARAEHLPRVLAADQIQVGPEVGRDRVVGHVRDHQRDLAVLYFP